MIKTLAKAQQQERVKFRVPRSVQDAIPIRRIWSDGIFLCGNQYSKTWSFTDINYAIAGKDDKTAMFLDYSELLNALDSGASAKITLCNRRVNKAEFERSVLLPMKGDTLDEYRREFNEMLLAQTAGSNSIVRERYLTVSVVKRSIDEARAYFARVGTDLVTHFAALSSVAAELPVNDRLRIFRDFFKVGQEPAFEFNIAENAKRGQHFKDWLCPDSMEFAADHFKIDGRFGRVLYLQDFASYLKDSFVSELCDLDRDLMLSIDILPVPTDEAARQLQNTLLGVETNAANWQRRQNANNNFSAAIPYDMELQRKETKEMLDDLTTRDQRMMFGLVTLGHLVFLDIDMGDINGMKLARQMRAIHKDFVLIFVTNYGEYAAEGYEVNAFRFLPKLQLAEKLPSYFRQALAACRSRTRTLNVMCEGEGTNIVLDDLVYAEIDERMVKFHMADVSAPVRKSRMALRELENQLEDDGFLRIHNSFLVNMNYISSLQTNGVTLTIGQTLPISLHGYRGIKKKYMVWRGRG